MPAIEGRIDHEQADAELLDWFRWMLWHKRTCGSRSCPICNSAAGLRAHMMAQIFGMVRFPENTIAFKQQAA
jgi:hypothetical protein